MTLVARSPKISSTSKATSVFAVTPKSLLPSAVLKMRRSPSTA